MVEGVDFGGMREEDVKNYFKNKNDKVKDSRITFIGTDEIATVSASDIEMGYNHELLGKQAYDMGRSNIFLNDLSIIVQGYINGINLPPSYSFSEEKLSVKLSGVLQKMRIEPVNSLFNFQNGKVVEFKPSKNGQVADEVALKKQLAVESKKIAVNQAPKDITIKIPIKVLEPDITTDKANNMGIREIIGRGTSLYQGSIPGRIYNVGLAATRINGLLVPPDSTFSFNQALGDVSAFTGYKQAYIIQNGRTVLGDGGGVCQVSTTLFRAILDAGLPITERQAHAYRVSYYEQDAGPGLDATVFSPTVDLKFKNDTGHYILIQSMVDPVNLRLTFELYGTKDGRESIVSKPVIASQTPAPPPLYQDDPNLPKDQVKQVDFAAAGAKVYFTRKVTKDGKIIIDETFNSNYRPWQAIFLKGTKEG
jgi:vancomycin resistance protein YoaR